MTADISEAFVLLSSGAAPTGSELLTREISETDTSIRVGLDKDNFRHLLVGIDEEVPDDKRSVALTLCNRELKVGESSALFADLRCTDVRLALVFERLVSDVVSRIENGESPGKALPLALKEWRELFRGGHQGLTVEQVVGLIGELLVLERLAVCLGPQPALEAWRGPDGHTHDFYAPTGEAIEVKATRSLEGSRVHISNIAQLDPGDVNTLHLSVFRLKEDQTAPTLDERIATLLRAGFPAADLLAKVQGAGHIFETPVLVNTRFKVLADSWWHVDGKFPGLRESRLSSEALKGVSDIKYQLSIDAVGAPLSATEVGELLAGWGRRD